MKRGEPSTKRTMISDFNWRAGPTRWVVMMCEGCLNKWSCWITSVVQKELRVVQTHHRLDETGRVLRRSRVPIARAVPAAMDIHCEADWALLSNVLQACLAAAGDQIRGLVMACS